MNFSVIQGDIADQSADVLVNAAGTSLHMGSGVAGALRRAANGPINEAAISNGPVNLGDVAVTDAFDLEASYVIHAAAMPHTGTRQATESSIRTATENALIRADELECESIVIPVLGTGAAGVSFSKGVQYVAEEILTYQPTTLGEARLIVYDSDDYDRAQSIIENLND